MMNNQLHQELLNALALSMHRTRRRLWLTCAAATAIWFTLIVLAH